MNKYKVVVDTSKARNTGGGSFLGYREELEKIAEFADIIIPSMVIDEIKKQKIESLQKEQKSFLSNIFLSLTGTRRRKVENIDIDNIVSELESEENIPYIEIELEDANHKTLTEIKKLALNNKPPFDETSDKGFKDAYIYFTTLEYIEKNKDKQIFFLTDDPLLSKSFAENRHIRTIKDFNEFKKLIKEFLLTDYFLDSLSLQLKIDITEKDVTDAYFNTDNNWVLRIETPEGALHTIIDYTSRELLMNTTVDWTSEIENLINSDEFITTHEIIETLQDFVDFFSIKQIKNLIVGASKNSQISLILRDNDVKQFYSSICTEAILRSMPTEVQSLFFEITQHLASRK